MTNEQLLKHLCVMSGYDDDTLALLEDAVKDSVCPGICKNCHTVYEEVEPDTSTYYCEECRSNSVVSCLVLAGII